MGTKRTSRGTGKARKAGRSTPSIRGKSENATETLRNFDELSQRLKWLIVTKFGERGTSEFARQIGIPQQTVRSWIDPGTTPGMDAAEAIIRALKVDPRWLLLGEGDPWPGKPAETAEGRARIDATLAHLTISIKALGQAASQLLPLLSADQAVDLTDAFLAAVSAMANSKQEQQEQPSDQE